MHKEKNSEYDCRYIYILDSIPPKLTLQLKYFQKGVAQGSSVVTITTWRPASPYKMSLGDMATGCVQFKLNLGFHEDAKISFGLYIF